MAGGPSYFGSSDRSNRLWEQAQLANRRQADEGLLLVVQNTFLEAKEKPLVVQRSRSESSLSSCSTSVSKPLFLHGASEADDRGAPHPEGEYMVFGVRPEDDEDAYLSAASRLNSEDESGSQGAGSKHILWGNIEVNSSSSGSESQSHNFRSIGNSNRIPVDPDILLKSESSDSNVETQMPLRQHHFAPSYGSWGQSATMQSRAGGKGIQRQPDAARFPPAPPFASASGYLPNGTMTLMVDAPSSEGEAEAAMEQVQAPRRRKNKCKDGKNKRDHYRKIRSDMMNRLEADPDGFQIENEPLPLRIANDERLKGKLLNRLRLVKEEMINSREQNRAEEHGAAHSVL